MVDITYEQFVALCACWGLTVEEGYQAMCFTSNIINQHYRNHDVHVAKLSQTPEHFTADVYLAKKKKEKAMHLRELYNHLDGNIYEMLKEHEKKESVPNANT